MSHCLGEDSVETIVTCEGDLGDPNFDERFGRTVATLRRLICTNSDDRKFRISKVEPWNSVRVTFSLGQDAAERLRILAGEAGGEVLARLGILSVQLRPSEQVISIRVAAANAGTSPATAGAATPIGPSPVGNTAPVGPSTVGAAPHPNGAPTPIGPSPVGPASNGATSIGSLPIGPVPVGPSQINSPMVGKHGPPLPVVPNAGMHKLQAMLGPPAPPAGAKVVSHAQTPIAPPGIPQVQIPVTPNRQFQYPQAPQTPHHIQIQQSKAVGNNYPPPPYPGALARPSVLSTATSAPDSKIADVEAASPLLVNLLQNDAASQNPTQNIGIGHHPMPQNSVLPQGQPQLMGGAGSRGFASTSAPQAVVHHRPPTSVRTHSVMGTQASIGSQGSMSTQASVGSQGPIGTQTPMAQVPISTQVQTGASMVHQNAAHTQLLQHQKVSVVQAPPVAPQVRPPPVPSVPTLAPSLTPVVPTPAPQPPAPIPAQPSPVEEDKPRSPSPPSSADLTSSGKARQYLINPLTGVLEPMSSESSDEDEVEPAEFPPSPEEPKSDLEDSPVTPNSNSMGLGPMTTPTHTTPSVPLAPQLPPSQVLAQSAIGASALGTPPVSQQALTSAAIQQTEEIRGAAEQLKLRLKLDKSGPYNVCYTSSSSVPRPDGRLGGDVRLGAAVNAAPSPGAPVLPSSQAASEPRVPPLHISLRGSKAAVVTRFRERKREGKTRKRSEVPPPPPPPPPAAPLSSSTTAAQTTPEPPTPALSPVGPPAPASPLAPTASPLAPPTPTPMAPTICVSAYPSEAEVASILRSVPEVTTDEKKRKRSHPKSMTPLRPQLEDKRRKVVNSTAAHSTPASGSYVKTLIKNLSKDHPRIDKVDRDREREREREREQREREQREREAKKDDVILTTSSTSTSTATSTTSSTSSSPETPVPTTAVPSFIGNVRSKSTEYQCKSPPSNATPQPPTPQSSPQVVPSYPAKLSPGDKAPGLDKAGEDSGIESMDALSEKSPNRGDSPNRKEEVLKKEEVVVLMKTVAANADEIVDEDSVEDPIPIRITPALYTYSNPDKQREGSPPLEIGKAEYPTSRSRSNSLSNSKSLLEQLLIEIPNNETATRRSSTSSTTATATTPSAANGRNHRIPSNRSPEEAPAAECPPAPPSPVKRGRKASESSTASHDEAPTTRSKRKCSENASELIKACIGVNTGPETVSPAVSAASNNAATPAPAAQTAPAPAPVASEEPKKRKVEAPAAEAEEVAEKRTALTEEALTRTRSKDEDKLKTTAVVGRRSARQEVKRTSTTTAHRKRTRPEEAPAPAPVEPKLRRRTAAKESAK